MRITHRLLGIAALLAVPLLGCDPGREYDEDSAGTSGIVLPGDSDESSSDDAGASDSTDETGDESGHWLNCGEQDFAVDITIPHVVLVLDKSHSMVAETWDHDGLASTPDITRWHSLHDVTADLVEALQDEIAFGAVLFPSAALTETVEATACTVEDAPDVEIGLGNADEIVAALPAAAELEIHGATPTTAGIATALAHLREFSDDEPRAMVLVTDGAANCSAEGPVFGVYDEALAPLVAQAAAEGMPTYVVGIDIVDEWVGASVGNPHERMSEVAVAGGVPREGTEPYYVARDETSLRDAVDDIAGRIHCRLELPELPEDPTLVHLQLDDADVPYVDSCEDGPGWRYADDGAVELCDLSCDDYALVGTIHARFDCAPEK